MPSSVTVKELVDNVHLKVLQGEKYLQRAITSADICRPSLVFAGYYTHYPAMRVQLLGITETSFCKDLTPAKRMTAMKHLCQPETPCIVISTDLPIPKELAQVAKETHIPILGSSVLSSRLISNMTNYLNGKLAKRQSLHGELVDMNGVGVLITGDSGIGKSETALELVRRGHRLVADDRVEIYAQDESTLIGAAPSILSHMMEIRGVGIIDVMTLYGIGAVMPEDTIDFIVHLETWSPEVHFDRLGERNQSQTIMGVKVPKVSVPVKVGRHLAIIIEAAAMNYRAVSLGYDAADTFQQNLNNLIKINSARDTKEKEKK